MKISTVMVAAALGFAVTAPAQPPAPTAPVIRLGSVTGVVQIKHADGSVMTVNAGDPVAEVPSGSEIIVVSGKAVVESGGVVVKANSGDAFTVNVGADGALGVAVTAGTVSVTDADGKSNSVKKGETRSTKTAGLAPKAKAPESIPADEVPIDALPVTPPATSAAQEKAVAPVSPSAP